ncbi:response regulator [Brevibacillus invocatus]|uniref:response regulator n=1 Tax=Brevibacillus invocatus TaxID=173959 RepID=UPI00204024E2|nr:response regulator [Brevibacillus invocatus]MCM3077739.1 response regulator [Brevibacillus invocatus]MCM3428740.1 response regulator [Brevibacillus invocatus]
MDINMPNLDGIRDLLEIKQFDPDARVIMCSAMAQRKLILHVIKGGASDFIVKPVQKEKMLNALKNY